MNINIIDKINHLKYSIRWNLFVTLGLIMLVCQLITVFWLWHESKEQIDLLVDLTLSQEISQAKVRHEEIEAIFALLTSTFVIMSVTLLLAYQAIKRITKPLELLQQDLVKRAAEDLNPINSFSKMHEIKAISSALNGLFYRLNETLQQERLFTADVAHELRTPLAGIRLHLELLERTHHINCQELIERIDRLVNTVEQLLTLARASQRFITGDEQLIHFQNNTMPLLANELSEMVRLKGQTLTWQQSDKDVIFQGDNILVCLLIRNLVENASRYSPPNSEIIIDSYRYNNHQMMLEVKDQGPGLDENKISQLTEAFFRMDRRHKGIGLGLSIVQRIIKLHKGELILKNRDDGQQGTIVQCLFNY
ncbi:two-component system sensor histidine kinase BasS [Orbus hercynius]|uniref:histidine kinase n=1 Tax=Orbus hercynius TaxID=593135 RepID=A0A495RF22_9GAMM|nr:two-component system sensor histidine kinase PmrB [Orbus hercynius]RKS85806.1 two-component system sensor histidine kinase BasS [Orbus hercynius]